jgi:hypothetical protein
MFCIDILFSNIFFYKAEDQTEFTRIEPHEKLETFITFP